MKSVSVLPEPVLSAGTFACNPSADARTGPPEEYVSVRKNGRNWVGAPEMHLNKDTATLTLLGVAGGLEEEVIVMKLKFEGVGTYSLTNRQAYYYTSARGHALTSAYELAPCSAGVLEITGYDPAGKLLEGNFRLVLTKERSNPENEAETLTFSDGRFRGRVAV